MRALQAQVVLGADVQAAGRVQAAHHGVGARGLRTAHAHTDVAFGFCIARANRHLGLQICLEGHAAGAAGKGIGRGLEVQALGCNVNTAFACVQVGTLHGGFAGGVDGDFAARDVGGNSAGGLVLGLVFGVTRRHLGAHLDACFGLGAGGVFVVTGRCTGLALGLGAYAQIHLHGCVDRIRGRCLGCGVTRGLDLQLAGRQVDPTAGFQVGALQGGFSAGRAVDVAADLDVGHHRLAGGAGVGAGGTVKAHLHANARASFGFARRTGAGLGFTLGCSGAARGGGLSPGLGFSFSPGVGFSVHAQAGNVHLRGGFRELAVLGGEHFDAGSRLAEVGGRFDVGAHVLDRTGGGARHAARTGLDGRHHSGA